MTKNALDKDEAHSGASVVATAASGEAKAVSAEAAGLARGPGPPIEMETDFPVHHGSKGFALVEEGIHFVEERTLLRLQEMWANRASSRTSAV